MREGAGRRGRGGARAWAGAWAAVAAVGLVALGSLPGPARATHHAMGSDMTAWPGGLHWGPYRWDGMTAATRGFWIVDRTGDLGVQEAIGTFVHRWGRLRAGLPALPHINWYPDVRHYGRGCQIPADTNTFVLVCYDPSLASTGVGGPTGWVGDHITRGVVKLRPGALLLADPCTRATVVAHELGHALGLHHSGGDEADRGGRSLMLPGLGPYGYGCPTWFNAADVEALRALYGHRHPDHR